MSYFQSCSQKRFSSRLCRKTLIKSFSHTSNAHKLTKKTDGKSLFYSLMKPGLNNQPGNETSGCLPDPSLSWCYTSNF